MNMNTVGIFFRTIWRLIATLLAPVFSIMQFIASSGITAAVLCVYWTLRMSTNEAQLERYFTETLTFFNITGGHLSHWLCHQIESKGPGFLKWTAIFLVWLIYQSSSCAQLDNALSISVSQAGRIFGCLPLLIPGKFYDFTYYLETSYCICALRALTCVYWGYGWLAAQITTHLAVVLSGYGNDDISQPMSNTKQELLIYYNETEGDAQK